MRLLPDFSAIGGVSFDPFIKQAEPIAFPDQAFESFSVASAEKKQDLLLKRIQMELFL